MRYSGGTVIYQSEGQHQYQPSWEMQQCAYNRYIMATLTLLKKICGISLFNALNITCQIEIFQYNAFAVLQNLGISATFFLH